MSSQLKNALLCASIWCGVALPVFAAIPAAVPQIKDAVSEASLVTIAHTHPSAIASAADGGAVDGAMVLPHVVLTLKRSPEMQAAFDRLVANQQKAGSADFQHWLKPADLRSFGPAQSDIEKVAAWVRSHGLTVNGVSASGMTMDIAGRADQLGGAFHTELRHYALKGVAHLGNAGDMAVPAALAPVLAGATLGNFFPRPNLVSKTPPQFTIPTSGKPYYAVVPTDFATIYNLKPLLNGTSQIGTPITGAGVTVAVIEQTNILAKDYERFRNVFGLSGYSGGLTSLHPGGCGDPGRNGDEVEAAIDAEWATAGAPDATVVEASCASSATTFGVETTLQNMVESQASPATIYSISYGGCETGNGIAFLQGWTNLIEEGASEGVSIMVSSGDSGSSCDRDVVDNNGLGVNGLASNPYDTSVGGTDFYDTALGEDSTYWSKRNTQPGRGSALSYVPEIPWDNSCANSIIAAANSAASGLAYCNASGSERVQNGVGGTGGFSLYYTKPEWQPTSLLGVPNDGARDQPDLSLFAANGIWGHFYLICMSDAANGGAPCRYKGTEAFNQAYGGTSVASPAFAGIVALEAQYKTLIGASPLLGNVAPRLYQLAQAQFSNETLLRQCNATLGNQISSACVFNNVTAGDNAEPCNEGTPDCYTNKLSTAGIGVLSTGTGQSAVPAYLAHPGYSLATGLGSVNAANLLYNY
jgi:pseudomonalisin